ncbi:hypothetical protein D3C76_888630 [compost metagenome]
MWSAVCCWLGISELEPHLPMGRSSGVVSAWALCTLYVSLHVLQLVNNSPGKFARLVEMKSGAGSSSVPNKIAEIQFF